MPDEADIANDYQARLNLDGICRVKGALREAPLHKIPSSSPVDCEWCWAEIPEQRRMAMPGCTLCVECQGVKERLKNGL
jgi:phage/conjugal plasmid C-4 type zinc finger TraR family protein